MIARIRWNHGVDQDVPATAIAWTSDAVEIEWEMETGEGYRTDWVSANDIRRPGEPAPAEVPQPPHTRAGQPRGRW